MPSASSALFGCYYGLYSVRCSFYFPNYRLSSTIHRRLRIARNLANDTAALQDGGFIETVCSSSNAAADSTVIRTLSLQQKEQISLFVGSLLEWNERMNLTAVKQQSDVMKRHVEDSLALLPPLRRSYLSWCCPASSPSSCDRLRLVDVGSGSGLPGLMLAIACPSWKITLVESMHKRCLFLEHVVGLIGLSNVEVLCERAENVGQCLDFRERFDVAIARAVAEMRTLAEYCLPLVRIGGLFMAAKGHNPQEEIRNAERAVQLMGGSILEWNHTALLVKELLLYASKGMQPPRNIPGIQAGEMAKWSVVFDDAIIDMALIQDVQTLE